MVKGDKAANRIEYARTVSDRDNLLAGRGSAAMSDTGIDSTGCDSCGGRSLCGGCYRVSQQGCEIKLNVYE